MKKLLVLLPLGILPLIYTYSQQKITAVQVEDKIEFRIDGNLFTSYIISEFEKYPYFFPVNGPTGASVTSMRNGNFPHHTSLFFGCDKVNKGNFWQSNLRAGQIRSESIEIIESGKDRAVIKNECIWQRTGANSPIKDTRIITVTAPSGDKRFIDFEIEMKMLEDVEILKTNHSFFSARMDPDLTPRFGGKLVNAEGDSGEKETFGKNSPWMDCYGKRGDGFEGMAILQYPGNMWYPSEWFTRDYGFLSPTPMFWPEDGVSTKFKKGDKLALKYRVIVHSGSTEEAKISQEFNAYKSSTK